MIMIAIMIEIYEKNGNILRLRRCGLRDATHGGFGLLDDLRMTYEGNQLASVFDNVWRLPYAGATDFDGVAGLDYAFRLTKVSLVQYKMSQCLLTYPTKCQCIMI